MVSRLRISAVAVVLTFGLSGCAQDLAKFNQDLAALNQALAGGTQPNGAQTGGMAMATKPDVSKSKPTQLIIPSDKRTASSIDEALPTIKKILAIHQCMKDGESIRQMNIYAVPGVNMAQGRSGYGSEMYYPNSTWIMKYHDHDKCVSVSAIDQWTMPALNALNFRVVYFADDSGETVNFSYQFKKMDDGSWKIAQFNRSN